MRSEAFPHDVYRKGILVEKFDFDWQAPILLAEGSLGLQFAKCQEHDLNSIANTYAVSN